MWLELVIALVVIIVAILWHAGFFTAIKIGVRRLPLPVGEWTVMYKFGRGAYKSIGPRYRDLCRLLPRNGRRVTASVVGMYYDNPETTPDNECRASVGVVVKGVLGDESSVDRVTVAGGRDTLDEAYVRELETHGYKTFTMVDVGEAACADHPFGAYVEPLSIVIAMMRVYNKLWDFIEKNRLFTPSKETPVLSIEVYQEGMIYFAFPLENTKAMMVPECV